MINHKQILKNIQEHIPTWRNIITQEHIHLTRLSGLSNACYKVKVSPNVDDDDFHFDFANLEPQSLLYRIFECPIVDWDMENELFQVLSDQGIGPKLYYQCPEYRIEGFFLSRALTIFEMRNDLFLDAYAEKICDFNYNHEAREKIKKYIPMENLSATLWMTTWVEDVKKRIPILREKQRSHPEVLEILDEFEKTFFFEGHQEYFQNLLCADSEIVLAHNDAQENNIHLCFLFTGPNYTNVILIDFEYIGWAPRAMDLANYVNETMLENAYPLKNGIACYLRNFMKDSEQEYLIEKYLERLYHRYLDQAKKAQMSIEEYIRDEKPRLMSEMRKLLLVNNYLWAIYTLLCFIPVEAMINQQIQSSKNQNFGILWAVWSLKILKEENEGLNTCFNFDFADARIHMFNHVKKLYNL